MPAKFVVQMKVESKNIKRGYRYTLDLVYPPISDRVWLDTVWSNLADAQRHHPEREYREVMTQW